MQAARPIECRRSPGHSPHETRRHGSRTQETSEQPSAKMTDRPPGGHDKEIRCPTELSAVSPLQGNRLKTTSSPGRRSAAIAAPLCPGLICCSPSGQRNPTPSHPSPLRRRLRPRTHGHPGGRPRTASNLQHRTPLPSPPHADRARPSAAAKKSKILHACRKLSANSPTIYGLIPSGVGLSCAGLNRRSA